MKKLCCIKVILRGFEMTLGLRVNFFKSILMGVNVDPEFNSSVGEFLHYEIDSLCFKYICVLVGTSPHLEITWDSLVVLLEKRLYSWKYRYVSLGGRVVLLNYVLNVILIFTCLFVFFVNACYGMEEDC